MGHVDKLCEHPGLPLSRLVKKKYVPGVPLQEAQVFDSREIGRVTACFAFLVLPDI